MEIYLGQTYLYRNGRGGMGELRVTAVNNSNGQEKITVEYDNGKRRTFSRKEAENRIIRNRWQEVL